MPGQFHMPVIFDLGVAFVFGVTGALAVLRRRFKAFIIL
jgi:hypothetical protein